MEITYVHGCVCVCVCVLSFFFQVLEVSIMCVVSFGYMLQIKKILSFLLGVLNFNNVDWVNQSFLILVKYIMGVSCTFKRFFCFCFKGSQF